MRLTPGSPRSYPEGYHSDADSDPGPSSASSDGGNHWWSSHSRIRELGPLEEDLISATNTTTSAPLCKCPPSKEDFTWATEPHELFPYEPKRYWEDRQQVLREVMSGFTVSFAQVGESIAFSFIAHVPPLFGLHAAWIVGLVTALFGSRTAMINGATAVRAVVVAPFVKSLGVGYLFYIVIMISIIQWIFGIFRLTRFVKLVPHTVMIGFKSGLSIILAHEQEFEFRYHAVGGSHPKEDELFETDVMQIFVIEIIVTMLFIFLVAKIPKYGKYLPPSLFGILGAVLVEYAISRPFVGVATPTIGDLSPVSGGLPVPFFLDPAYNNSDADPTNDLPAVDFDLIEKIAGAALIAAAAGAVEAVMMMEVTNDLTDTSNPKPNQQLYAMSAANFISGLMGSMGGGATIGTSVINCKNGANGEYRISATVAALSVLLFVLAAAPLIESIPTSSLVGIMFMVVIDTFYWEAVPLVLIAIIPKRIRKRVSYFRHSKVHQYDAVVIVTVVVMTQISNLFFAVLVGVFMTSTATAWNSGKHFKPGYSEVLPLEYAVGHRRNSSNEDHSVHSEHTADSKVMSIPETLSSMSVHSAPAPHRSPHQHHHYRQHRRSRYSRSKKSREAVYDPHGYDRAEDLNKTVFTEADEVVKIYHIEGPLFFATVSEFVKLFTPKRDPWHVEVTFQCDGAAVQDFSAFHALNKVGAKYNKLGKHFLVRDLDLMSQRVVLKADALRRHFDVEYGDEILRATPVSSKKRGYHIGKSFRTQPHKDQEKKLTHTQSESDLVADNPEFELLDPKTHFV